MPARYRRRESVAFAQCGLAAARCPVDTAVFDDLARLVHDSPILRLFSKFTQGGSEYALKGGEGRSPFDLFR